MKRSVLGGMSMLAAAMAMMGQTRKPVPTTTITSSSPTLQLPGSLTLTTTVTPPAATGGVPTGKVTFLNGTASLGTGTLAAIPSTQSFSASPNTAPLGSSPFGLFTLPSATPPYSVLGMLDWDPNHSPEVTIYSGQGTNLFTANAPPTQFSNSGFSFDTRTTQGSNIDAYAIGDFNRDGLPDVLLHGFNGKTNQYYLLPGTAGDGFNPNAGVIIGDVAPIQCDCTPELAIAPDDFNGDGYPDVAYAAKATGTNTIGVALNAGAGAPGSFPSGGFHSASEVKDPAGDPFYPTALASGHFTSSGYADLVVAGYFFVLSTNGVAGNVALFLGNGDGTFGMPTVLSGTDGTKPTAVATADLRGNGMTDVILASAPPPPPIQIIGLGTIPNAQGPSNTNNIQVLFGDGNGGLTPSSTVTVPVAPSSLTITDFNNDGYPDILVTGADGSLNLILNDGTGHFSTATAIGTTSLPSLTTSGDFNGDGLADIAEITNPISTAPTPSTASELLNSASSQTTVMTPPQTLPAGTDTLTASFPPDNNFAASTSRGIAVTVTQTVPTITWPTPSPLLPGSGLTGTQLDAKASVSGSFAYNPPAGTVLPIGDSTETAVFAPTDGFDYSGATATQTITVLSAPPTASATAPKTTDTGQTVSASLTVNSYSVAITPTVTLNFAPAPPNTVGDPKVLFTNNMTTQQLATILAHATTSLPIDFNSGSTAGTITLKFKLMAGETDVTPSTLTPLNISVPAAPPVVESIQLTRSGHTMTAAITGRSSPRDMTQAQFHFTPAPGKDLKTTDLTVNLSSPFGTWYGSPTSANDGTMFLYTQPFTLDSDATTVGSVAVTLTNSKGDSQPSTAH